MREAVDAIPIFQKLFAEMEGDYAALPILIVCVLMDTLLQKNVITDDDMSQMTKVIELLLSALPIKEAQDD